MQLDAYFTRITAADFSVLKNEITFKLYKAGSTENMHGENVYFGDVSKTEICYLFSYCNDGVEIVSFVIKNSGKRVLCYAIENISQQTIHSLFRGNITKFCLQLQGFYCLHASAIVVDNQVVLFMGSKGAGKSTLASFFYIKGHEIWCDDYSALVEDEKCFLVRQGESSLKVNADILSAFNIPENRTQPVYEFPEDLKDSMQYAVFRRKSYLSGRKSTIDVLPKKIAGIFFLRSRTPNPNHFVEPISASEVLSVLMEEILLPGLNTKEYLKIYFESSMSLLQYTPCFKITAPEDISRIGDVYDSIIETLKTA